MFTIKDTFKLFYYEDFSLVLNFIAIIQYTLILGSTLFNEICNFTDNSHHT